MSLPPEIEARLKADYRAKADMQSARDAAEQLGQRHEFEKRISVDPSNPWQTVRNIIKSEGQS